MSNQIIQHISFSRYDHLLGISILIGFLLPHSNTALLLANPIFCLLLVFFSLQRKWNPFVLIVVVPLVISFLLNVTIVTQKALLSFVTILMFFSFFPFVGRVKINNFYLYFCLGYIILSQIVYLLNIPFLESFFDQTYPVGTNDSFSVEHMRNTITTTTLFDYRLGGLYHNANNCAEFLCMLLAFFLVVNQNGNNKGVLIFSVLTYLSILLTGSRTGFVVSSLILYFGLIMRRHFTSTIRFGFILAAILGFVYLLRSGVSLRGFDVESGLHNSADLKLYTFLFYLSNESDVISLLFGHLDSSLFIGQYGETMNYFDCEYGDLVFRFGFVGFLSILFFWWKAAKRIEKGKRVFFLILLWA